MVIKRHYFTSVRKPKSPTPQQSYDLLHDEYIRRKSALALKQIHKRVRRQKKHRPMPDVVRNGYVYVARDWPEGAPRVYVKRANLLMEKHLNRLLVGEEFVHHKDFDKLNDIIENLQLVNLAGLTKRQRNRYA